jgi:hypothetical protein
MVACGSLPSPSPAATAIPALAYRFDTADGFVVCSGDTTVYGDLVALAHAAGILVHCVAHLSYFNRHGTTGPERQKLAGPVHRRDGGWRRRRVRTSQRAHLTYYVPAEPGAIGEAALAARAASTFTGRTTAGRDGLRRILQVILHP